MTAIVKSNTGYTGRFLGLRSYVTQTSQEIFDAYKADVVADGGAIGDEAYTLATIDAARRGGYDRGVAAAVSARFGRKLSGSTIVKLYSLFGGVDGVPFNTVDLDTTLATPYNNRAKLDSSTDRIDFTAIVPSLNGQHGYVVVEDVIGSSGIGYTQFTAGGHLRNLRQNLATGAGFMISTDTTSGNLASILTGAPDFGAAARDAIHWYMEEDAVEAYLGLNGVWRKGPATGFTPLADASSVTMSYQRLSGTAAYLHEFWCFNDASREAVAQCAYDRGLIY
jgi:hypothetical protein